MLKQPIRIVYEEGSHVLFEVEQAQRYQLSHGVSSKTYQCVPLQHTTFDHPDELLIAIDDKRKVGLY
jgi:hypothetical protein